jgi:hypothetical protein
MIAGPWVMGRGAALGAGSDGLGQCHVYGGRTLAALLCERRRVNIGKCMFLTSHQLGGISEVEIKLAAQLSNIHRQVWWSR